MLWVFFPGHFTKITLVFLKNNNNDNNNNNKFKFYGQKVL